MTMSCEPSLLFRQQVCIGQLRSFLETLIPRSGGCPSRLCAPGRGSWSTRRPWPSTPSSSTPSGCPSLLLSLDHLVASLHQASRGHSRSRILEISYQDTAVSWTGLGNTQTGWINESLSQVWLSIPDGYICERLHPQLHQPTNPGENHPASLPTIARGAAGALQRARNLSASKGNFATLSSSWFSSFELDPRSALELGPACWSSLRSDLFKGPLICLAFVINLCDPIFIKFSCSILCPCVTLLTPG